MSMRIRELSQIRQKRTRNESNSNESFQGGKLEEEAVLESIAHNKKIIRERQFYTCSVLFVFFAPLNPSLFSIQCKTFKNNLPTLKKYISLLNIKDSHI